MIANNNNTVHN